MSTMTLALTAEDEARFWSKVDKSGDCWLWTAALYASGYGAFRIGGRRTRLAHRLSYSMTQGAIPDGLCVLHRCDVRACVNPAHLRAGTKQDNTDDMMERGRHVTPRGERVSTAKLTAERVREMRGIYATGGIALRPLARMFGISKSATRAVVTRSHWRHVV